MRREADGADRADHTDQGHHTGSGRDVNAGTSLPAPRHLLTGRWYLAALPAWLGYLVLTVPRLDDSYFYDESVSIGRFVMVDSLSTGLTIEHSNNHALLTAINWVVFQLGGTSEVWQRLPATLATVATVGVVVWFVHRHSTAIAATTAGVVVALNPLVVFQGHQARGYAFALLTVSVATVVLVEGRRRPGLGTEVAYAVAVAFGLLAHLYTAVAFAAHGALAARHPQLDIRRWFRPAMVGGLLAGAYYLPMLRDKVTVAKVRRRDSVDIDFALDTAEVLFGWVPAGLVVAAVVAWGLRRLAGGVAAAVVASGLVGVVLVAIRPIDLYPRFLIWVVPVAAMVLGVLAARDRRLLALIAVVVALGTPAVVDQATRDSEIRDVAQVALTLESTGVRVCALGAFAESLAAYDDVPRARSIEECDAPLARRAEVPRVDPGRRLEWRRTHQGSSTCVGLRAPIAEIRLAGPCP